MPTAGIKLAIRTDHEAGLIRAFFSTMDDTNRFEVATLRTDIARECDGLFEDWTKTLSEALAKWVKNHTGVDVVGFQTYRPHDKN